MLSVSELFTEGVVWLEEAEASKLIRTRDGKTYEVFQKKVRVNGKMVVLTFRREVSEAEKKDHPKNTPTKKINPQKLTVRQTGGGKKT